MFYRLPGPGNPGHPPFATSSLAKPASKMAAAALNGARDSAAHASANLWSSSSRHAASIVLTWVGFHVHLPSPGVAPSAHFPAIGSDHHSPISGLATHCPAVG